MAAKLQIGAKVYYPGGILQISRSWSSLSQELNLDIFSETLKQKHIFLRVKSLDQGLSIIPHS